MTEGRDGCLTPWLPDSWYIAAESRRLPPGRLLPVEIGGLPLVLFRGRAGRAVALEDRCPHRGLALSRGRLDAGSVACAYHGWTFDERGSCCNIPSLVAEDATKAHSGVPVYPVKEQDGFVWVHPASTKPQAAPFPIPHAGDPDYGRLYLGSVTIHASLLACVENFLDVSHTRFVHGRLARVGPLQRVTPITRITSGSVEVEYPGEPKPKGILFRLFTPHGEWMRHVDRFLAPSIVQTEYDFGDGCRVLSNDIFTPVDRFETRLYSVTMFRMPIPRVLFSLLTRPFAKTIVRQDRAILEAQAANNRRFRRERYTVVASDLFFPHLVRILRGSVAAHEEATTQEIRGATIHI